MRVKKAIEAFFNAQTAKGLSPESTRWYRGILNLFAQRFKDVPSKPENIESFLADCKCGDERKHGYYRALRAFYNFLQRRYRMPSPIVYIDPPRRKPKCPRPLAVDDLDQLLAYPHSQDIKAALLFLVDTGARVGEAARLDISDLAALPWGYTARINGKTGQRVVPISVETYHALMKTLPFRYTPYLFRRKISQAFKDARVEGSGINLRHTFATLWLGDELVLQRIMGHSHLSTTQIYRALRTELVSSQHNQFTPLKMVFSRTRSML